MASFLGKVFDKAPVPFVPAARTSFLSQLTGRPTGNPTAQMQAMSSVGTLFAIVNALSEATARAEWKLYRKQTDGRRRYAYDGQDARTEVTAHLALNVWNKPNPFYTRQELVESFQQHVDLTGEGWLVVSRDNGSAFPSELWVVRPDRMAPVPHPVDFLTGYVYTGPDGALVPLDLNQVIQLRMPNPLDPYRGMGPVQSILVDLDSTKYSAEWNKNFFLNSAEPGGIIQVDEGLSDDEFRQLRERWNEQHRGVANAHRVAILEHGQWVDKKYTMRDMQFVELRSVSREVIREAFRFPKPMLGTVEDVNRANADAAEVVFSRWQIKPRLERIKQALNNDFLPMFGTTGQGVEFDYCDPTPEDVELEASLRTASVNAAVALVTAGFDPAETLMAMGLPMISFSGLPAAQPGSAPTPMPMEAAS